MLNHRHQVVVFITLVMTGSALLAGATVTQGLGIAILGGAFAWLIGSNITLRAGSAARNILGRTWGWLRVPLAMLLVGILLGTITALSNFNSLFASTTMALAGVAMAPIRRPPANSLWMRVLIWVLGSLSLGIGALTTFDVVSSSNDFERFGRVVGTSIIALPIGLFLLSRGYQLILRGVRVEAKDSEPQVLEAGTAESGGRPVATASPNRVGLSYLGLSAAVGLLLLWFAATSFVAFSHAVFEGEARTPASSLPPFVVPLVLAWWAYAAWEKILVRKPNTDAGTLNHHRRVTFIVGAGFVVVLCASAMFGIQNGQDRLTTHRVEEGQKSFVEVSTHIGAIKSRDLSTTADYITAYDELARLLPDWDSSFQRYSGILEEAELRERRRGPLSIRRVFGRGDDEWMSWDKQIFELLRADSELTKRQCAVVQQMSVLPSEDQVEFWNRSLKPLLDEEDKLREKLAALQARQPKR